MDDIITITENNANIVPIVDGKEFIDASTEYSTDLIDDENADAFKFFNMQSRMNDIKWLTNDINEKAKAIINDEDELAALDEIVMKYNDGDIEKLSNAEVDDIYDNGGNPISLDFDFDNEADAHKFKRDFLEFRRKSIISYNTLDEELQKMNEEFTQHQEELNEIAATYGNMDNLIKMTLQKRFEAAETEHQKELFSNMIKNFDNALTLDNIKDFVKSYKGRSIVSNYRDEKKAQYVYRTYKKVCDKYQIITDLSQFGGIEEFVLGEEFNIRPNIFLFTIIYYISTFNNKDTDNTISLFITQFSINVKNLIYNKFDSEEKKETFVSNIKEIIQMIG